MDIFSATDIHASENGFIKIKINSRISYFCEIQTNKLFTISLRKEAGQ